MYDITNKEVRKFANWAPVGNIIPHSWWTHPKLQRNGKPFYQAIILLGDIVYWFRPTIKRDEATGRDIGFGQKFRADLLQRSRERFGELFGLSKQEVSDALKWLDQAGLIRREYRTISSSGMIISNVLHIGVNAQNIKDISAPIIPTDNSCGPTKPHVSAQKPAAMGQRSKTNTDITKEISQKNTTPTSGRISSSLVCEETKQPFGEEEINPQLLQKIVTGSPFAALITPETLKGCVKEFGGAATLQAVDITVFRCLKKGEWPRIDNLPGYIFRTLSMGANPPPKYEPYHMRQQKAEEQAAKEKAACVRKAQEVHDAELREKTKLLQWQQKLLTLPETLQEAIHQEATQRAKIFNFSSSQLQEMTVAQLILEITEQYFSGRWKPEQGKEKDGE